MGRYLVRRIFLSLFSIFGLITATFFLLRCLPGGPFDDEVQLAPQVLAALKIQYGLDQSLLTQYTLYLKNLAEFNLGHSILYSGKSVSIVIMNALPRSFGLGAGALFFGVLIGISSGFLFFITGSQVVMRAIHFMFLSAPTLFLGPLVILVFGLWLNWFPITVSDRWASYILPLMVLTIRPAANLARLLIGGLEESLAQPWAITAKAYGFSNEKILMKFAFKQSLIPVLSYLGQSVAGILSGSLLVEIIFNIGGLGSQFIESLVNRDYAVIISLTLIYGLILVISNLLFDIIIYSLDARIEKN